MPVLIDGYNLLYAAGLVNETGPSSLEQSRHLVVSFVASAIPRDQWKATTIVFDGRNAPPGLPSQYQISGITVRFAPRNQEADDLLEQLIVACHSPRRLLVVSSDHRVQRAAKRRRAKAIDSEKWAAEIRSALGRPVAEDGSSKPDSPPILTPEEWHDFLSSFSAAEANADARDTKTDKSPPPDRDLDVYNPFPKGYADDVLKEEQAISLPRKRRNKK